MMTGGFAAVFVIGFLFGVLTMLVADELDTLLSQYFRDRAARK